MIRCTVSCTTVETEVKYAGYIAQQERQIDRLRDSERRRIPDDFAFESVPGLSTEVQQKLGRVQPETLGQAGRIPGVSLPPRLRCSTST